MCGMCRWFILSDIVKIHYVSQKSHPKLNDNLTNIKLSHKQCKWTESEGSGKHRRTIYYKGREDYISTFSYLVGSYNGKNIILHFIYLQINSIKLNFRRSNWFGRRNSQIQFHLWSASPTSNKVGYCVIINADKLWKIY